MKDKLFWRLLSFLLVLIYLCLSFWRLELFPPQVDIYYHLGVMQGFNLAGGIVTWDFWEFAPQGKPHIYPPFLHLLMLLFYKLGFSKISIAIFFSYIIFPLYLISFWFIVDRLFSSRLAFFVVVMNLLSFHLFLGLTNTLAGTLALVILFWAFYSLEQEKKLSFLILVALLFYTHYALSIMGMGALFFYILFNKEKRKFLFPLFIGIFLALPWIIHLFLNLDSLLKIIYYDRDLPINILLFIFSFLGIFYCFKLKEKYLFFIFLFIFALLGTIKHPYRLFNTQGAVGLIFVSSISLEKIFELFFAKLEFKKLNLVIFFVFFIFFFSHSVIFSLSPFSMRNFIHDSVYWNLLISPFVDPALYSFRNLCLYRGYGEEFKEALGIINTYTEKGDIIYSNFGYQAGILCAFTERTNATMSPYFEDKFVDNPYIRNAKLIVWLKNPDGKMDEELVRYISLYNLEKIKETKEFFYFYRNPNANSKMEIKSPVVSSSFVFLLLFFSFGILLWDWIR